MEHTFPVLERKTIEAVVVHTFVNGNTTPTASQRIINADQIVELNDTEIRAMFDNRLEVWIPLADGSGFVIKEDFESKMAKVKDLT